MSYTAPIQDMLFNMTHLADLDKVAAEVPQFADAGLETAQAVLEESAKLAQDDGLITVTDTASLVKEISTLLTDEDYRLYYGRHAVEVLHQNQGALQRLLHLLEPYLPVRGH